MEQQVSPDNRVLDVASEQRAASDLTKLIRKFRWIGMETEAEQLQTMLRRFPPERRASLLSGPHSTD